MAMYHNKKPKGYKVKPLKITDIREIAHWLREQFQIKQAYVDLIKLYDFVLPGIGVVIDICEESELKDKHGETFPNEGIIKIREDVYEGACDGNGRDRFTLSHELGHLILHSGISLARQPNIATHRAYEDSEWQADTFAAEFLMTSTHINSSHRISDIVKMFGASDDAARVRLEKLSKERVIK